MTHVHRACFQPFNANVPARRLHIDRAPSIANCAGQTEQIGAKSNRTQPICHVSRRDLLFHAGLASFASTVLSYNALAEEPASSGLTPATSPKPSNGNAPANGADAEKQSFTMAPLSAEDIQEEAEKRIAAEDEERKQAKKKPRNRLRELEEIRSELAERELELLQKSAELQEKEQTLAVLKEEIELEKRLRTLLTKEKEKAEEQAALAMGLCTGASMLP